MRKGGKVREYLPRGFRWEVQLAKRKSKRGRAMGGMVVGIKSGIRSVKRVRVKGVLEDLMVELKLGRER